MGVFIVVYNIDWLPDGEVDREVYWQFKGEVVFMDFYWVKFGFFDILQVQWVSSGEFFVFYRH